MSKITIENVTKVFGKRTTQALELLNQQKSKQEIFKETGATVGVNNVSFTVEEGEIFVIMGLSGSGKSTLVRMFNRLIDPTKGNIYIDDKNLSTMDKKALRQVRREKLSMVFQNFGLFPHRTILENTEYGLEIQGVDKAVRQQKAQKALENAGLGDYKDQYPSQLSGGMQQRVGLARALANDPEILLMDEAFSALDPLIRREMQDELIELQANVKKTIIFITHDLNEALRIGDKIALMKDGSIVQIGSPEEILTHPANDYVEKFVEDVDRSKVLTAENIMQRPETLNIKNHGPRFALEQMRSEGISSMLVVDSQRNLLGYITAEDASEARKKNIQTIESILKVDIPTVTRTTSMNDIFSVIHDSTTPVAVVDEGKLVGIIVRGAVIAALAGESEVLQNV
ncbi:MULTISPECIES: quaternary amine ABC transporter ATP-binding protein [Carnobacterium]|uniref:Quaternary amine transport ATP-binding protein n=1 Tax=Carnobacterium inhibens TaxID=147709 RepID=A0ABR7T9K7_9LACT|nr:glycine betaine/L-proline ABC transporter ATP-binding protein [Carnobacterium inhibens]MBC9824654.1 betaine/proline/choline family ABC transporter ATP-binding protein [Carnobacterium inhibens]MCM3512743.1 glycine betaine/L-proline ABC transporter ATP-binding protein [Carnobacterium inhibens]